MSGIFLALTLRGVETAELAEHIRLVDPKFLALGILSKGLGFLFMARRGRILLAPLHRYSTAEVFRGVLVGYAGNNTLPFRAGELLKVGYLSRVGGITPSACLAVIVTERLVDVLCMLLVFLATTPLAVVEVEQTGTLVLWVAIVAGAVLGTLGMARRPELAVSLAQAAVRPLGQRVTALIIPRVERFAYGLGALSSPRAVLSVLLLSLATWGIWLFGIQTWMWAFDLDVPWYAPAVILAFAAFGGLLPSAPGSVGTYHWFVRLALTQLGVASSLAISVALVGHAASFVPWTVGAIAYLGVYFLRHGLPARPPEPSA